MSLPDSAPLPSAGSGSGPALAPPFEPAPVASSPSTLQDERAATASAPAGTPEDKKKLQKRSLFGFGKKKSEAAATAAAATSPSLGRTGDAARASSDSPAGSGSGPKPGLSPSPPFPPPKAGGDAAPKPLAKDVPARKPTSPTQSDGFSTMSASITSFTSSGAPGGGGGGGGGGGSSSYYVLPPASPGRSIAALSSSPRVASPAGSQIFERDVQESGSVLLPNSPAIPSHITTENYIPPVLDASSEAITDDHLDPDTVEIITHAHHQPAGLAVAGMAGGGSGGSGGGGGGGGVSSSGASGTGAWLDDLASSFVTDRDDSASNYGSFDTTDVRRLSFISFADVVQAEQQQQQQQQQQATAGPGSLAGLTSLAAGGTVNRSPSPMRSPTTTDRLGTSPPTSKSGSVKGLELSPQRKPLGSPTRSPKIAAIGPGGGSLTIGGSSTLQVGGGEIAVETMSQALRRTGSGDLSSVRSMPQSPV